MNLIEDWTLRGGVISSLVLLVFVFALRLLLVRAVQRREKLTLEERRRWLVSIRSGVLIVTLAGLVFIWAQELRTFAVSLVAIAVAIVIATKELILCFSGSVLRAGTKAYSLGDRIEIAGLRGDVVDISVFATRIREIGPGKGNHQFTGRDVLIPHSLLLNTSVINESSLGEYMVQVLAVPATAADWQQAEKVLLAAAQAECAPFIEGARSHLKRLEERVGVDSPSVEPRVTLELREAGKVNLLLRYPAPARRQGPLEQAILRRFLEEQVQEVD